jgi:phospholipid transport system transporter-binding protein
VSHSPSVKAVCADCFELAGELSRDTVPALWEQRHNICCGDDQTALSLRQLGRVDSAGLAFLVALCSTHQQTGRQLRYTDAPQQLMRLVAACGLSDVLPITGQEA